MTYSVSWGRQPRQPLIIAHRGASADAVENTLAAFRLARADGADGVELDVMRCATGEVVVFHDDDLERLGKRAGLVRATSWAELREIDLGAKERIPLLDEALEELGPLLVNVELKTRSALADDGLAAAVAASLRRHATGARALVSSFDPLLLARFRLRAPELATGLLFAHDQSLPLRRAYAAPLLRPTALHPEARLVDARRVRDWHARGYALNVWTVDDAAELRLLAALGVDGVITNRPRFARSVIHS
ncbi:MAG: glycerophosphodiester phosphodiesterase [Myxococcales bacterium]|nr:glycerophosphodiester phosphodiesterase [Myxococcales bacterium]